MEKKEIEVRDVRKILKIIKESRPNVSYYTCKQNSDGYSQTNEKNLSLNEVHYKDGDSEDDIFGEYDKSKTVYSDDVYDYGVGELKLDWFIEVLDDYINFTGKESNDWTFETFFEWFQCSDSDSSDKKPNYFEIYDLDCDYETYEEFFEEDGFTFTLGYNIREKHDISWYSEGLNNFNYYGILINNIETETEIITLDLSHSMSF